MSCKAYFQLCSKSINLSNMGKQALTSCTQSKGDKKTMAKRQVLSLEVEGKSKNKTVSIKH